MSEDLFAGLEEPNHTQTPNAFYDDLLKKIETVTELKVTLAIIRQTFGWHKKEDELSLSQLEALTGLSRQGVCDGLKIGLERGSIVRRKSGQSFVYSLKLVSNTDQSTTLTSQQRGLEVVSNVDRQLVSNADTQKKAPKEKKESSKSHSAKAAKVSPDSPSSHPAVQAVRAALGRYPQKVTHGRIIEAVGDEPDADFMLRCATAYASKGKYTGDLTVWLFDWYVNRRIPSDVNGKGKSPPGDDGWRPSTPTVEAIMASESVSRERAEEILRNLQC